MKLGTSAIIVFAACVCTTTTGSIAPTPNCDADEMDKFPRLCRMFNEMLRQQPAVAHEIYHEEAPVARFGLIQSNQPSGMMLLPENGEFLNGVKRQDVDHVFLRFGRRT